VLNAVRKKSLTDHDCARLRLEIDAERLAREFDRIDGRDFLPYSQASHDHIQANPDWHGISLTSSTGKSADDYAARQAPIEACNKPTEIAARCPYAMELVHHFTPFTRVRFFRLNPYATIFDHTDDNLKDYALARLIFPIIAHADSYMTVGGGRYYVRPGESWFLNDCAMHGVANPTDTPWTALLIQTYDLDKVHRLIS